jgi:hypothetical protein
MLLMALFFVRSTGFSLFLPNGDPYETISESRKKVVHFVLSEDPLSAVTCSLNAIYDCPERRLGREIEVSRLETLELFKSE